MFVCCECCVLSGRGLCNELIICPEESYRLWCVVACDSETSRMRRPWPALCRSAIRRKKMFIEHNGNVSPENSVQLFLQHKKYEDNIIILLVLWYREVYMDRGWVVYSELCGPKAARKYIITPTVVVVSIEMLRVTVHLHLFGAQVKY